MSVTATPVRSNDVNTKFPLQNDLMLRAARRERVERTPVWVFRQAGRHLPEYNEYKKRRGKNFLELLNDPVDVAECTLQPVRRYNLDAAILFSDILVILQAMGIDVTMPGGVGITVPHPIASPADYAQRVPVTIDIRQRLAHVLQAVRLIKEELQGKVPLIGFSAAPWTLFFYLVGGSSKKHQSVATQWLHEHPKESGAILDTLNDIVFDYLCGQVEAGADMIQVFEAMGEFISPTDFNHWALPRLASLAQRFKALYPHIPLLVFPRGACYSIGALQECGYDVVTIDTHTDRKQARAQLLSTAKGNHQAVLQGNFDVNLLINAVDRPGNSVAKVGEAVRQMLSEVGPQNLIANLGEGLTGKEDPALVAAFIDNVHDVSAEMIRQQSY